MNNESKWKYIDTHAHVQDSSFDVDRADVMKRAVEAGVFTINVGTDLESSKKAVELAKGNDFVKAIVGIHPTDANGQVIDFNELEKLAGNENVVAIGECGLDYFYAEKEKWPAQKELFIKQIEIAERVGKPLMLHIRNGKEAGENAYADVLKILNSIKPKNFGNVHFFAGSPDDAQKFIDLGFTLSFTGVITFARNYDEVIKRIPLDMILSETDSPFVTPLPYRGKRNEPVYVKEIVKKLAELRNIDEDSMADIIQKTSKRIFKNL